MTYSEMLDSIERRYDFLCDKIIYQATLSARDIENLKYTNTELYQAIFFQEYLRLRTLATIEAYHEYLRDKLLETAQIDIGALDESTS